MNPWAVVSATGTEAAIYCVLHIIGVHLQIKTIAYRVVTFLVLQLSTSWAMGAPVCSGVLRGELSAHKNIVISDAYMQWLKWEQQATLSLFKQSTEPIEITISKVPVGLIKAEKNKGLPTDVMKKFIAPSNREILWPHHPFNQDPRPPFQNLNLQTEKWRGYLTASRSIALMDGGLRGFTLKMPTNRPHGLSKPEQPEKVMTNVDVLPALVHSNHIIENDKVLEPDSKLIVLKEVMTISEKETREGIVLRDARQLDDGNYYLPALSIPYVGKEIAKSNGKKFETFFAKHFARALGEAKARFLLRYGMHLEAPNPQNILIQFDRDLKPTGKIVFRDISDAYFVKTVAEAFGFQKQMKVDTDINYAPHNFLRPFWNTSRKHFDMAGAATITPKTLNEWGVEHNRAFAEYLEKELHLSIPEGVQGYPTRDGYEYRALDTLEATYEVLASSKGQKALREYRAHAEFQAMTNRPLDAH